MKYRIRRNAYDNWYGYAGTKRIVVFVNSPGERMEDAATAWLATMTATHQPTTNNTMNTMKIITVKYLDAADWRSKQQPIAITIADRQNNHAVVRLTVDELRQLVARLTAALPVE